MIVTDECEGEILKCLAALFKLLTIFLLLISDELLHNVVSKSGDDLRVSILITFYFIASNILFTHFAPFNEIYFNFISFVVTPLA